MFSQKNALIALVLWFSFSLTFLVSYGQAPTEFRFHFKGNKTSLTKDMSIQLDSLSITLKADSSLYCRVLAPTSDSKRIQRRIWKRTQNLLSYLTDFNAIPKEKFAFVWDGYDEEGDNYIILEIVKRQAVPQPPVVNDRISS